MQPGYLYCLHSDNYAHDFFKVGLTKDLPGRLGTYKTSLLRPKFILTLPALRDKTSHFEHGINEPVDKILQMELKEKAVHTLLTHFRVDKCHEFFRCTAADVQKAFDAVKDMSAEDLLLVVQRGCILPDESRDNAKLQARIADLEAELSTANKRIEILTKADDRGKLKYYRTMYHEKCNEMARLKNLATACASSSTDTNLAAEFAQLQEKYREIQQQYKETLEKLEEVNSRAPSPPPSPSVAKPQPPVAAQQPVAKPQPPVAVQKIDTKAFKAEFDILYDKDKKDLPSCNKLFDILDPISTGMKEKLFLDGCSINVMFSGGNRIVEVDTKFSAGDEKSAKTCVTSLKNKLIKEIKALIEKEIIPKGDISVKGEDIVIKVKNGNKWQKI
jgi:hypothetical protein